MRAKTEVTQHRIHRMYWDEEVLGEPTGGIYHGADALADYTAMCAEHQAPRPRATTLRELEDVMPLFARVMASEPGYIAEIGALYELGTELNATVRR